MSPSYLPTNDSQGHYMVASCDGVVYSQVIGLGTMNNSVSFKEFIDHLQARGYRKYIFDLARCDGFDSTFMGILLGVALSESAVILVNVKEPHRKLLTEVGIHRVVSLCGGAVALPDINLQKLEHKMVDPQVRLRLVLAAHENLVRLEPGNQKKFAAFLDLLREDLGENSPL